MLHVNVGSIFAYLDYAVAAEGQLLVLSCFSNSELALKGVCANIGLTGEPVRVFSEEELLASYSRKLEMEHYHTKLLSGREQIYQSLSISASVNKEFLFIHRQDVYGGLYSFFMSQYEFPILREWTEYLWTQARNRGLMEFVEPEIHGDTDLFTEYLVIRNSMNNDELQEILSYGLSQKKISITNKEQNRLHFSDMDDYFEKYGHTLVDNLEKLLKPLSPMKELVEELAFVNKSPFPQQAAIINGAVECLNHKNYAFLIESMGAGKTLQGMGIAEAYFNQKYLKQHPDVSIKDVYMDGRLVNYRVIVMCPPHLVEKWAQSIREEIPYAKVLIVDELNQLVKLRKEGKKSIGKQFYVMSKDSGKLSYSYTPVPHQIRRKHVKIPVCKNCWTEFPVEKGTSCKCGCKEAILDEQIEEEKGLICPECGELLLPVDGKKSYDAENGRYRVLCPEDFAQQSTANRFCRCCGTALWTPACKPIDQRMLFQKPREKIKRWKKISHFTNKAKKARKSVWVMTSREKQYKALHDIDDADVEEMEFYGPRRFGLTRYVKKYLKNYFDMAIFDEVQEYKAGGSAQGYAMHDLIKATKKQLALTGTIAGGYASDLFYTLYRLDPARMKGKGYSYGSVGERKFVEKYGTVETIYEVAENATYHTMSRGRVITPQRCLPGISVLIFTEFLLDSSLFLDLSDLSRYLPKLQEEVVIVPLEDEIRNEYQSVRQELKRQMVEQEDSLLMGSYLQFSLSYTDMPYNRPVIISPLTGEDVVQPADLSHLISERKLLNKEKELIDLVECEQSEGRNIFIYCEYTGNNENSICYRLKEILEEHTSLRGHEVQVLESSYPAASKREAWMHAKAAEGTKIFITNAKCVATGLDFAFTYQEKSYNYPTIIFYQTGYDMIKIWQASHRHYRLNQKEECRTFFIVSQCTIQLDAVELVATKEVATSSIQGQFSSEGLSTMAKGVDPRVILAQSVAEKSEQKERGLRKMMDVLNQRNNMEKGDVSFVRMKIFSEITGYKEVPQLEDPLSEFEWITGGDILNLLSFGEDEEGMEDVIDVDSFEIQEEQEEVTAQDDVSSEGIPKTELDELLDFIFN